MFGGFGMPGMQMPMMGMGQGMMPMMGMGMNPMMGQMFIMMQIMQLMQMMQMMMGAQQGGGCGCGMPNMGMGNQMGGMMGLPGFPGFPGGMPGFPGGFPGGGCHHPGISQGGTPVDLNQVRGGTPFGRSLAQDAFRNANGPGGYCYKWVANSLERHGVRVHGCSAYMAADQLARNNKFQEVSGIRNDQLKKLPPGAVVVWNRGNGHPHGHISIASGDGREASDRIRNQITNYGTSFRVFLPK